MKDMRNASAGLFIALSFVVLSMTPKPTLPTITSVIGRAKGVDDAAFPATMNVDYVRFYKMINK
jgi:hypothetical protein